MNSNSRFYFVLLSAGSAVGLGNVFLYPYLSFRLTGLFFIPYMIALALLGVPLLMLEFSIGQYFNKNIVDSFASVRKWLSGIGWLMLFNAFIAMSYYAVILSWHIIYIFVSFGLQWRSDAKAYFFSNVLRSGFFRGFTVFSLPVFIALIIAWAAIFFCIRKGHESMKKAFLIIFPFFVMLALLFLAYSLSLENALAGIYAFLKPDIRGLFGLDAWINAFSLAAVSLGLSFGIMHALGRKAGKGFVVGNSFIVAVFKLMSGIIIGFAVFSILGFLAIKNGTGISSLAFSGAGPEFTVLAQAFPFFYMPTLFSMLFFAFIGIFFVFGAASLAYSITHVLVHKFRTRHFNAAVFVSGFGFLLGLLFIISPGFYIMDIVSHFIYYNVVIGILLEAVAIGWFFDSWKIAHFISQNSSVNIGASWRIFIRYIAPLILLLLLLFRVKNDLLSYNSYPFAYVLIFGVGTVMLPMVAAFLMPQRIFDRR